MVCKKNKIQIFMVVMFGLLSVHSIAARELRTPLSFLYYWWTMYPLERPIEEETCWQFETTGGAYHREADSAFIDKNSTDREPLAGIMFGQPVFNGCEAFPGGTVPNNILASNPFVNFAQFTPNIGYSENGAYWGFALDREICNTCWRVGLRGTLPFRRIEVKLDDCCSLSETLADVAVITTDVCTPDGTNTPVSVNQSYAFRLDFLSSLRLNNPQSSPFVIYGDGTNPTTMNGNAVNVTRLAPGLAFQPAAHVVKSEGTPPAKPFFRKVSQVETFPELSSSGNGALSNESRAVFDLNVNYSGSSNLEGLKTNQRSLWIVPTARNNCSLSAQTAQLRDAVLALIQPLGLTDTNAVTFLDQQGIKFETSRLVGLGDFITQFYANWTNNCWFFEGVFGVVWPTAYREKNPGNLLRALFPRGNNKHYEIQVAALGGWEGRDWLKIKADALYSYVTPRSEHVAGSFAGSTVKNIGPATEADVSWHYFVTDVDFTFIHPKNCDIGLDVGYQAYIKLKDKVRFKETQGTTLAGTMANFDPCVLELRTDVVAHKVRMQGFWQGDFFQFFGGWNHVFAGKNATRDTDWYIGAQLYF